MIVIESKSDRAAEDTTGIIHLSNNNRLSKKDSSNRGKESAKNIPVCEEDTRPMRVPHRRAKN